MRDPKVNVILSILHSDRWDITLPFLNQLEGDDGQTDFVKKLKAKDAKAVAKGIVKASKVVASEIPAMAKLVVQLTKKPSPDTPKKRKRRSSVLLYWIFIAVELCSLTVEYVECDTFVWGSSHSKRQ